MVDTLRWSLASEPDPQLALFDAAPALRVGRGEYRGLEFLEVNAHTIINEVDSGGRLPFQYSINVYRGCSHACTYCFARPTHAYLGLDVGRDFDTKIVVKINAADRVRAETARWCGETIAMGTNTDPYQAAEGKYRLTRGVIEVLAERNIPFSILTKSPLVLRDLDVLVEAAASAPVRVDFSIACLDDHVWRSTEPGTPHPQKRVDAVRRLNEAGIPSGVLVAPLLPGISDSDEQLDRVVGACVRAGAEIVLPIPLHLKAGVREHFMTWLEANRPDLVGRYRSLFENRSYQSNGRAVSLAKRIDDLVARHGGVVRQRRRPSTSAVDRDDPPQLRLAL